MKKVYLVLVLILVGTLAFAQSGVIREVSGTVEMRGARASAFVPANVGDRVGEDTIISTGVRSSAIIEVGSSLLTVRPLTRLALAEISSAAGTETLNVNLQAGRVRVDINPPAGTRASMTVVGPQSTASVRGTSFELDTRNLQVISGNVVFKGNQGQGTPIKAGASSTVGAGGYAVNPVSAGLVASLRPTAPVGSQSNSSSAPTRIGSVESPGPGPSPGPSPGPGPGIGSGPGLGPFNPGGGNGGGGSPETGTGGVDVDFK